MSISSAKIVLEGELLERARSLAKWVIDDLRPIQDRGLEDVYINGALLDYTTGDLIRMIRDLEPYGLLLMESRLHAMRTMKEGHRWMGDEDGRLLKALHAINRDAFPDSYKLY
jgi:hypothetical protein